MDEQNEPEVKRELLPDARVTVPRFEEEPAPWRSLGPAQWQLMALVVALAGFSLLYRWLVAHNLDQTSLLFIGVPAFLAVVLAAAPKARTLMGGVMRGMTFALLFSGIFLGEGFICIVMAAPLFYAVALLVVGCVQWARNRKAGRSRTATLSCLALVLLPVSFEGTRPGLTVPGYEAVTETAVVEGTPVEVRERLSAPLRVEQRLPFYLRLRFPHPVDSSGQGLAVGDERRVGFAGGHGMPGGLVVRVEDSGEDWVRFRTVEDMSKIAHWLKWQSAELHWSAVDARHTRVTCTLRYERQLAPAWYFGPWERYAVGKTAEYLMAANAGPAGVVPGDATR